MEFDLPKDTSSIIKVIGVGGGGSNAVNHMYGQGIIGVDFIVCNTDRQALDISPVPYKIQLGPSLTEGRGAGAIPEIGMNAAIENIEEIRDVLGKKYENGFRYSRNGWWYWNRCCSGYCTSSERNGYFDCWYCYGSFQL
jgi:hypothetical protein